MTLGGHQKAIGRDFMQQKLNELCQAVTMMRMFRRKVSRGEDKSVQIIKYVNYVLCKYANMPACLSSRQNREYYYRILQDMPVGLLRDFYQQ